MVEMDLVAVIINVRTDIVATLALAGLRRNAPDVPVRLVNCKPSPASRTYFAKLADNLGFRSRRGCHSPAWASF